MKRALLFCLATLALTACGDNSNDFTLSSDAFFASDWETSYQKLDKLDCSQSPTHGSQWVKIYYDDAAAPAYNGEGGELPDGAIVIKPQFSDDACETMTWITAMKKDSSTPSGWVWQRAEADGTLSINGQNDFCINCHTGCPNDMLCEAK